MNLLQYRKRKNSAHGQVLVMFVVLLPVLLLFVGLTIDFGVAYVTKSALSKAVDAAALCAMKNIKQGQSQATALATNAFNANYGSALGRDANPPVLNIAYGTDASNNTVVNVSATATLNTYFLGLLPQFKTLAVSANAQSTRPKLIMSLVLDRSGSMTKNGGSTALPPAVVNFLTYFDDSTDQVADVSFSSIATVDQSIGTNFTSPITNAVNSMKFGGSTYTQGGLLDGQAQINSIVVPAGQNVVKAAVFFTDGWANTVEDTLACPASTLLNFGGCAPPEAAVGWCSNFSFMNPVNGSGVSGCTATTFPSQQTGTSEALNIANISNEAMYRANLTATSMRGQGIVIYSIGLGDKISEDFLQQIANDPASSTYDPTQPEGSAVFAATAADLNSVFQTIAAKILLRLSQ
jgi:Flp pilus assembly protein TadG